jgi:hypothetical protein
MTDGELLRTLLESPKLSELEREAFDSMLEYLDGGKNRELSPKQRDWARSAGIAKGIISDEAENLWSSGKVPRGIPTKKTRGEEIAASVLAQRPMLPPGRRA